MKIRTAKYIIREGIFNIYRNIFMTLASVGIITATLIIMGIFLLLVLNLNENTRILKEQPEMEVFCSPELTDMEIYEVRAKISGYELVEKFHMVTREEAFQELVEIFENRQEMLEGYDESIMPVSFIIELKDPTRSDEAISYFKSINGVESVRYSLDAIRFISAVTNWVRVISTILIAILLVVSLFIISNTIKLTVFARRKEINIMKYIGATDWFIRWPFIVEGAIIGFMGSILAFIITGYAYNVIVDRFNRDFVGISSNFIRLVELNRIGFDIIMAFCLVGVAVGAVGSLVSIRRYLRV